ncbi:sporozoite protein essential for cell traversal [Plasmodium berghei]|uniref:Sporozoite protein essential for cell traversal n=2 Tax=Plasmodium berghei TaxID=5821 RepID=A0A509APC6_PLABA|nr:sporozoite protein essential for cell traversal [Plasmodium berghei ANKA]CXJ03165.1 sporozoite protein essential for cell traversal [Plasmodium berghei]SCL98429.1 sporozoite protein essential for cell traversal [Plasmodium berghei]SCM16829.1 sporozoite protein essential for cell traversal [Plasmodium berghei]SCM18627.1 sporozoite protein essential for cell traversal [Plasmodium berghei]SCN28062.1 sporozoite protein essential for cell traversal [Plasmodium berghei]|eukprot:XP_034423713.1 sporozoite protein essential for cell traversal [Plasmodium berghei ANKA]
MKIPITILVLFIILKCVLSFNLSIEPKGNNISLDKHIKKETNIDHSKNNIIEEFDKLSDDFSNDINATKQTIKDLFLDIEASFEDTSDDVVKLLSKYSFVPEEKLNIIDGILRSFIENNKTHVINSSNAYIYIQKEKIKNVCNFILKKLNSLIQINELNKSHIILKYGKGEAKKGVLESIKNNDDISKNLKSELLKYENVNNQNIRVSELINFITPIYDDFIKNLTDLINDLQIKLKNISK